MPIISLANTQGSSGKTTATIILATSLVQQGASVVILECDPNRPIMSWRIGGAKNTVIVDWEITESTIISKLDAYRKRFQFVFVDLQSAASRLTSRALARSQLVIIPVQASRVDVKFAVQSIHLIQEEEAAFEKVIPYRILFTRTSPVIKTRFEKALVKQLADAGIPRFQNHLIERVAFKSIFDFQQDLTELDKGKVNGLPAARDNALRLTSELIDVLTGESCSMSRKVGSFRNLEEIEPEWVGISAVSDAKTNAIGDRHSFVSGEPLVKRSRRKPAEPSANLNIRPPVHVFNRFVDFCERNRYSYPEALDELLKKAGR